MVVRSRNTANKDGADSDNNELDRVFVLRDSAANSKLNNGFTLLDIFDIGSG